MPEPAAVPPRPAPARDGPTLAERVRTLRDDSRVAAAVVACVAVAAGVAWFRAGVAPGAPPAAHASRATDAAPSTTTAPASTTSTAGAPIVVDVVGAVRVPGVVRLGAHARVLDAIRAAGGAAPGADLARLNLAAVLADGARVAVPLLGQPPPSLDPAAVTGAPDPAGGAGDGSGSAAPGAPLDVNTATAAQLEALPGIGPSLAAAIVQERERNGPFRSVDDLDRVPGIGPARVERLRGLAGV